jgi:GNAT superfamily N-acetyltransferase
LGSSNIAGREGYDRSRYADMLTGSVDFVPGVSEAAGVGDVRREVSQGNYPGAALAGVATALGVVPVIGDAAAKAVRGASQSATRSVRQVAEDAMKSIPGLKLGVYGNPESGYTISRIEIPKDLRNTGLGTSVMRSITQAADQEGARLMLTPTSDFGGDKNRLTEFYKRLGFINNSGRTRDFTTMEAMIRSPSVQSINSVDALDMSQAARMQKADEMGLDPSFTLYHGTGDDIQEFDLNIAKDMEGRKRGLGLGSGKIYLHGGPQSASAFAMNAPKRGLGQNPNVMQLISTGNYIDENDYKQMFMENSGGVEITSGNLNMRERDALIKKTDKQVMEKGFDGIAEKYKDSSGKVVGYGQVAIFDPANIRSVNAAFDPAKRDSANLMAGVGGVLAGGSALRALLPQEQERQPD